MLHAAAALASVLCKRALCAHGVARHGRIRRCEPDDNCIHWSWHCCLANWSIGTFKTRLYFLMTSCTTIGYGDMVPRTDAAKVFTAIYVPLGFIPVFRFALPYGRAICQCVQGLSDKVIPRSYREVQSRFQRFSSTTADLSAYLSAMLAPARCHCARYWPCLALSLLLGRRCALLCVDDASDRWIR